MPTRGRLAVLSWGLAGVMEHQIVASGREGGNLEEVNRHADRLALRRPQGKGTGLKTRHYDCQRFGRGMKTIWTAIRRGGRRRGRRRGRSRGGGRRRGVQRGGGRGVRGKRRGG